MPATTGATAKPLGEHVIAEWSVGSPAGIYVGPESVWVPHHSGGQTTRIDPTTNEVLAVVDTESVPWSPATEAFGSTWNATPDNKLDRMDPSTNEIVASIALEDGAQDIGNGVLFTDTAVWVIQNDKAEMIKIDPATNSVESRTPFTTLIEEAKANTTVPTGKGTDFNWLQIVGDEGEDEGGIEKGLLRLDPSSGEGLTFLPWGADQSGDGALAITDDAVWYGADGHIYRINVGTNEIDATYETLPGIIHLGIGFGSLWVTNYEGSLVQRLDVAL